MLFIRTSAAVHASFKNLAAAHMTSGTFLSFFLTETCQLSFSKLDDSMPTQST